MLPRLSSRDSSDMLFRIDAALPFPGDRPPGTALAERGKWPLWPPGVALRNEVKDFSRQPRIRTPLKKNMFKDDKWWRYWTNKKGGIHRSVTYISMMVSIFWQNWLWEKNRGLKPMETEGLFITWATRSGRKTSLRKDPATWAFGLGNIKGLVDSEHPLTVIWCGNRPTDPMGNQWSSAPFSSWFCRC